MKLYIQNGNISGIESELKRLIKKDREYVLEWKEIKRSRTKRLKIKQTTTNSDEKNIKS
ncbi:MAG: hypothetical protein JZU65_19455 [Chlorobium sp.]|jgi:hypothetical protein|nr:hypothetical protein [Chlorobium sp.]